jgi:HlyD family secretion protein
VDKARAQVDSATASLATAQANYADVTAGPTQSDLEAAQAQVENARSSAAVAENNLKQASLIAPVDGIVASVSASVGQFISGGAVSSGTSATSSTTSGTAVAGFITLTNISEPQISAQVSEADIGRVRPGQRVSFTVSAFPGRTFNATVARIDPIGQMTSNVVNYNVVSIVEKPDVELLPAMTATVTIITEQVSDVVLVPNAAIAYASTQASRLGASRTDAGASETAQPPDAAGARGTGTAPRASGTPAEGQSGQSGRQGAGGRAGTSSDDGAGTSSGGARQGSGTRAGAALESTDSNAGTASAVVILQDGEPVLRRIRIGTRDDRNTQVIFGLQPGDQVVTGQTSSQQGAPKPSTGGSSILPTGGGGGVPKR